MSTLQSDLELEARTDSLTGLLDRRAAAPSTTPKKATAIASSSSNPEPATKFHRLPIRVPHISILRCG